MNSNTLDLVADMRTDSRFCRINGKGAAEVALTVFRQPTDKTVLPVTIHHLEDADRGLP